jgi:hypothetical protein
MRKPSVEFNYVKGEKAYLILWRETFNCLMSIDRIESCFPNLELMLINKRIIAYKFDCPVDLPCMEFKEMDWEMYTKRSFSSAIWVNKMMMKLRDKNE